MENYGKSNVVGRIREEEIFILDEIKSWQKFRLQEVA
ncbi:MULTISPECIES: phospho-sugar glycosidase domain-containing protein [unclassified Aerococcus]|nr:MULTISPECIES: phospho-sugar glycosidase domain-containing protein [unclassified Aerococcus]